MEFYFVLLLVALASADTYRLSEKDVDEVDDQYFLTTKDGHNTYVYKIADEDDDVDDDTTKYLYTVPTQFADQYKHLRTRRDVEEVDDQYFLTKKDGQNTYVYKLADEDDDVDDDTTKYLYTVPTQFADQYKHLRTRRDVEEVDDEYFLTKKDGHSTYIYKLADEDDDVDDETTKYLYTVPTQFADQYKHLRTRRSPDDKYIVTKIDGEHVVFKLDEDDVDDVDDDAKYFYAAPAHIRKTRSSERIEGIEVKKANNHFLNLLTKKPKTTQVQYVRTPLTTITKTPVNNVATTLIKNAQPVVQIPTIHTYPSQIKAESDAVVVSADDVIASQVYTPITTPMVTPTVGIQTFNPVHTPLLKTFNTNLFKTVVQTPVVQTPFVQTPFVQTPVFKTMQSSVHTPSVLVQPFKTFQAVQTPTLVNQPIFKTLQAPVVKTVAQTPVQITKGYVAANPGAVHTAPLPQGPSKDGLFSSYHINLPNQKA